MEAGYICVEFQQLQLGLTNLPAKDLVARLDLTIDNGFGVFQWVSTGSEKYSTDNFKPLLCSEDDVPDGDQSNNIYLNGFNDLYLRTTYIDLNSEVLNGLANAILVVKVMIINEKPPEVAPVKGAKNAPPVEVVPAEELLVQLSLPLSSVIAAKNSRLSVFETLSELFTVYPFNLPGNTCSDKLESSQTVLTLKTFADNDLAEYVLGSRIIYWINGCISSPPATWGLQAPDVVDPKAKIPPTALELRTKYLDNIATRVRTQDKVAKYSLSIGGPCGESAEEAALGSLFPQQEFSAGTVVFDDAAARGVKETENIRARGDLWSVKWSRSPVTFLHRSQVRRLVLLMLKSPTKLFLPLMVKKTPTTDAAAVEGAALTLSALLDISTIINTGVEFAEIRTVVDVEADSAFSAVITLNSPLLPELEVDKLAKKKTEEPTTSSSVVDPRGAVLSGKTVSSEDGNKDSLGELREEISRAIKRIGQEYVSKYPEAVGQQSSHSPREGHSATVDERKSEFLQFLASSGIFHELKSCLKPRVLSIIRDRDGPRGRALGRSEALGSVDLNVGNEAKHLIPQNVTNESVDAILSELYVFLLKECSLVLNSMFSSTIIDRDASEVDSNAYVDDEEETPAQSIAKLLNQADDAFSSGQYDKAETLHLERIQIISHNAVLGSDPQNLHSAYFYFGEFLLQQTAHHLSNGHLVDPEEHDSYLEKVQSLVSRAREALSSSYQLKRDSWRVGLLLGAVLVEAEQFDQAEAVLLEVIGTQLAHKVSEFSLESFSAFDGYESDALCPVDPMCYSVLAALFTLQGFPLRARKALLLANRSFIEGKVYKPDIHLHGTPRRTIVLTLSQTGLFLFKHALVRLGQACASLAVSNEQAVTAKAAARGKPATTVPHIRQLLKRLESTAALYAKSSFELLPRYKSQEQLPIALQYAVDSQLISEEPSDEIQALIHLAKVHSLIGSEQSSALDALLKSIGHSRKLPVARLQSEKVVPLDVFIQSGRLLLQSGSYTQARLHLIYGSTIYTSATLYMLLAVALLHLGDLKEAEDTLIESNLLDNRHPEIWGYLCLACLSNGPFRTVEAEKCLDQSLRLGLADSALLRELATSFMSIDKLQTAEDLIRRAIQKEGVGSAASSSKPVVYNRKLLAEVLAAQNKAATAVEEYRKLIADERVDAASKFEMAGRCGELLQSLGREEELATLKSIVASLGAAQ